jgi:hypothetical protein
MIMVRPLKGERPKKTATFSVDPVIWKDFQNVVEKRVFPQTSTSAHLEVLMRQEIARLSGEDPTSVVVNEAELQKRLNVLERKRVALQDLVEKAGGDASCSKNFLKP